MKMKIEKRIQVKAVSLGVRYVFYIRYTEKGDYKNIFKIIGNLLSVVCVCVCVCLCVCVLSNCVCRVIVGNYFIAQL